MMNLQNLLFCQSVFNKKEVYIFNWLLNKSLDRLGVYYTQKSPKFYLPKFPNAKHLLIIQLLFVTKLNS